MNDDNHHNEFFDKKNPKSYLPNKFLYEKLNRKEKKEYERQNKFEEYKLKVPYPELFRIGDIKSDDIIKLNISKKRNEGIELSDVNITYNLPSFILQSGLVEHRREQREILQKRSLRDTLRERLNPKIINGGNIGNILDRNKELISNYKYEIEDELVEPGKLSKALMNALSIKTGDQIPWVGAMDRFGFPPAYKDIVFNRTVRNDGFYRVREHAENFVFVEDSDIPTIVIKEAEDAKKFNAIIGNFD